MINDYLLISSRHDMTIVVLGVETPYGVQSSFYTTRVEDLRD